MNNSWASLVTVVQKIQKSIVLKYLSLGVLPAAILTSPALGAERLYASYGVLEVSIPVKSLEVFAKEGIIDENWDGYAQYVSQEWLDKLRTLLQLRANLNVITVSQFLYTSQGEVALQRLGKVIRTQSRLPGFFAIRAALILAAADPEGLTVLNILQKFPTYGLRIDLEEGIEVFSQITQLIDESSRAIAGVERLSNQEAAAQPAINVAAFPNLEKPGPFTWQQMSQLLKDPSRSRAFYYDIYLPQPKTPQPLPVVVISHGLASDRTSFDYLAQHLASYGFVVVVPEHPGSNTRQLEDLATGKANELAKPLEFIDRPLDVKILLDQLGSLSQSDPLLQGRLNLEQVGVIGQSFGGYTAFALAGADINQEELQAKCYIDNGSWNVSLLLQCRARNLPTARTLKDDRVKAIIAINPVDSTVQGQTQLSRIKVPVMMIAGTADTVAPALPEQILPFSWLTTPNKYLVLMKGSTHFSVIRESTDVRFPTPAPLLGPEPALARRYLKELSVAFMKTHIANQTDFSPYLQASYINAISQNPLQIKLLQSLTPEQLQQILKQK